MKNKPGRRKFIKHIGLGGIAAGIVPVSVLADTVEINSTNEHTEEQKNNQGAHGYNGSYSGENLNRIAFPIGGMGAGMFCIEGTGALSNMSVRNKPDVFNEPEFFAAISIKGMNNGAKILEGPVPDWKKFGRPGSANGSGGTTTGLPRFHDAVFKARFPFATVELGDKELPVKAELTAWSPFIPTDENNSSLPVGGLRYVFTNIGKTTIDVVFSYNAANFLHTENGKNYIGAYTNGFILSEAGTKEKPFLKSDFAIFTDDDNTVVDHCWFRGGWFDPVTMAWNEIKNGGMKSVAPVEEGAPGASLYVPFKLSPGEKKSIRVYMCWYIPDTDQVYGTKGNDKINCDPASVCCSSPSQLELDPYDKDFDGPFYKPWYSSRFENIETIAAYWKKEYDDLLHKTTLFSNAFYSATLPPEVMEAIACNLSILKSPTLMRQYDGRLWSFEGCGDDSGCCHGSCTHVWNYAQAIPHLFPKLERSLRHTEFCESQSTEGHQNFRAILPIKPADHSFYAAADGQLGGIMKVYREWRISGNNDWIKKMFPMVKKSLDYCISTWDPKEKGVIEEPHHNTYDIEFWGPEALCTGFYLGALTAFIAIGNFLQEDVDRYKKLLAAGKDYYENNLYNGEYFFQEIKFTGLKAGNPVDASKTSYGGQYSDEAKKLLEQEGPKYQYGKGCLSDGILGAWVARMCSLNDPVDSAKIKNHVLSVHKYNFKANLSDHANPQRPSYALGDEGGLLLCSWPRGGKLSLPFVYSDEVWTGIEHQVAAHLMLMGNVNEGLEIVRASRNRYNGTVRNPFDEYECGHWYARALSSYGYFQALTGVRYDAVDQTLYVESRMGDFTSFLSTENGFGNVVYAKGKATLKVVYGNIDVKKVIIATT
jgi:uncharacterized protein (DUF608 family)